MKKKLSITISLIILIAVTITLGACSNIFSTSDSREQNNNNNNNEQVQGGNRPSNPTITRDRAIEIAYEDLANRGINATFHSSSGMDFEHGQWVWELLFRTHGERMPYIEYYISVENGNIVKFEWDD